MPYKWVDPEVAISYFGVKVYHVYKSDNIDDKLQHIFTTNIGGTDGHDNYEFDIRDLDEWNERSEWSDTEFRLEFALRSAIENQSLELPDGVSYTSKIGSFNWYTMHPDQFISNLSCAAKNAIGDNLIKLERMFPHLVKSMVIYNNGCVVPGDVINPHHYMLKLKCSQYNTDEDVQQGSFFWYLYRSGSFVTYMANAINYTSDEYRVIIKKEYPQMIAAYNMPDWHKAPPSFQPYYNAR